MVDQERRKCDTEREINAVRVEIYQMNLRSEFMVRPTLPLSLSPPSSTGTRCGGDDPRLD
jgi:hypothetical protein